MFNLSGGKRFRRENDTDNLIIPFFPVEGKPHSRIRRFVL